MDLRPVIIVVSTVDDAKLNATVMGTGPVSILYAPYTQLIHASYARRSQSNNRAPSPSSGILALASSLTRAGRGRCKLRTRHDAPGDV